MAHGFMVHGSGAAGLSALLRAEGVLSSRAGERRAAPLERKRHGLERHLDERALSVRAREDGHARRDLQGHHDFEERQDRQDKKGARAARGAESADRVAVGDFSSRAGWVESDRRGQALVEMTVAGRVGLYLGFSDLATLSLEVEERRRRAPLTHSGQALAGCRSMTHEP
jgi:hypothetical protein